MTAGRARFVTATQQSLALAVVLAVLAPAASVVSLEVVGTAPGLRAPAPAPAAPSAPAEVEQAPVEAVVTQVPVTPEQDQQPDVADPATDVDERALPTPRRTAGEEQVTSAPAPVDGFGTVGVTWEQGVEVEEEDLAVEVRTRDEDGSWSGWTELEYHDDHAPDPGTPEAADDRPGTDPLVVGEVADVQVRATGEVPADLTLAVIEPGESAGTVPEEPAIDTAELEPAPTVDPTGNPTGDALDLQAGSSAPRPHIFSRAQWGADERWRSGSPSYGTISGGFVHHTVNGNDYTREQVPGILRSIYSYHTRSRGWSDVGYNFLVDRFGRIWEGRAGGVARAVIGAHTYGYNHDSFAVSAIGNFETVRPTDAMLRAYGALMAWKLGLHGVDPEDRSVVVGGDRFAAISGHRDAGSTACPGRWLYERLPTIRAYAGAAADTPPPTEPPPTEPPPTEPPPVEPEPEPEPEVPLVVPGQVDSDLADTPHPDLVVRRASDGRGMILPTGGLGAFRRPRAVAASGWGARDFLAVPDITRDGRVDLLSFDESGALEVRPGLARGGFGEVERLVRRLRGHELVASVGDVNGDDRPDLVARRKGRLVFFPGTRWGRFRLVARSTGLRGYLELDGAGDVTGDGLPDLWGRDRRGRLFLHRGLGGGEFAGRSRVDVDFSGYVELAGGQDYTADGVPDLVVQRADGALVVLPSRGDGTLGNPVGPVRPPSGLRTISGAGQVTDSEAPDLLATRPDGALVVLPHRGTYDLGRPIDTGRSFHRGNLLLNAGDFTGDGHGDVIMRRRIGSLWLFRGDGSGRLSAPTWIGGKRPFRGVSDLRVTTDVTGDGRPDVLARTADGQLMVWPGAGAGRLERGYVVEVEGDTAEEVASRSSYDWVVGTSDLRGRGRADLVVRDSSGYLYRLDGRRKGYRPPRYLGEAGGFDLGG